MCSLDPVSIIHGCIEIPSLRDICGCGGPINLCRPVVMYMHFHICVMTKRQELKTPCSKENRVHQKDKWFVLSQCSSFTYSAGIFLRFDWSGISTSGFLNCVARTRKSAGVVSQARPLPRSADRFQYAT